MPSASVAKKSSRAPQRVANRAGRRAPELIFGDLWAFDPAPESADPKLKPRYDLFINGKFVNARTVRVLRCYLGSRSTAQQSA